MSDQEEEVRFTLRLPRRVYDAVARYARGNGKRPRTSINSALVFLIERGLREVQQAEEGAEDDQLAPLSAAA